MMNDNQLKNLLAQDHSSPQKPMNEWKKLEEKLAVKNSRKKFIWPTLATICVLVVVSLSQIQEDLTVVSTTESKIAEFLLKDKLFAHEEDNLYAWVE